MKKLILLAALITAPSFAQGHYSRGYVRQDGTYVAPHYQTNPNTTRMDNYSTQGNVNPYNGRAGTVNPYAQTQSNPMGSPYNNQRSGVVVSPNPF